MAGTALLEWRAGGGAAKRSRTSRTFCPVRTHREDSAGDGGLLSRASSPRQGPAAWSDAFEGAGQRFGPRLREAVCRDAGGRDDGAGFSKRCLAKTVFQLGGCALGVGAAACRRRARRGYG